MSYKTSCASHISKLGLNDAEITLLNSEIAKKKEAVAAIKEIQDKPEFEKGDKKLLAQHRRLLNDVKDTVRSDYQRYAKDVATDKLATLNSRRFKDYISARPAKLKAILTNSSKAGKDSIWAKKRVELLNFTSYCQSFKDIDALNRLSDAEFNDINNPVSRSFIDHMRNYMDNKHLETTGKKYFNSENEHVVKLNGDKMRSQLPQFIEAVKQHTNASEMLLNNFKGIDDRVEGFEGQDFDSAVGKFRDEQRLDLFKHLKSHLGSEFDDRFNSLKYQDILDEAVFNRLFKSADNFEQLKQGRLAAINDSFDKILNDFKDSVNRGSQPTLSISKMTFRGSDSYSEFLKDWSMSRSPITNYTLKSKSFIASNVIKDTMGYTSAIFSAPNSAFDANFTKSIAQDLLNTYLGSGLQSTAKQNKVLKAMKYVKGLVISARSVALPMWSAADIYSSRAIELSKSNQLDFFRDTAGTFARVTEGFLSASVDSVKNVAELRSIVVPTARHQMTKVGELMSHIADYESIHNIEEIEHNRLFAPIEAINKRFVYDPQINIDNAQRFATWQATARTLVNLNHDNPCGMTQRLDDLGFSKDEQIAMGKAIKDTGAVIEDVKDKNVRDNLYILKYNTDMSAVPTDVTPLPLLKIQNPVAQSFLSFFMNYHIKTATQFISVIRAAKGWQGKVSGAMAYSLMSAPANMILNYIMNCVYQWQLYNPFDSFKHGAEFIGEAMLGQLSRPGMMGISLAIGDRSGSNPLINPLASTVSNVYHTLNSNLASTTLTGQYYSDRDKTKDIDQLVRTVSNLVPFGQLGQSAYKAFENSN